MFVVLFLALGAAAAPPGQLIKNQFHKPSALPAGGLRLELSSGRTITARAVVHTAAPTQPVLPAWVRQLQLQRAEAPGGGSEGGAGCRGGAGLAGPTALPPQVLTWDQVDLRSAQLEARRVVVVGGGMAAATLAAGAAARGAQVTLVCRRWVAVPSPEP